MDKENVAWICTMEYYSALKKKKILPENPVTTWMNPEDLTLSEISQGRGREGLGRCWSGSTKVSLPQDE